MIHRHSSTVWQSRAFTLAEVMIVVVILAVLAGLSLPVFRRTTSEALQVGCARNLREIYVALQHYMQDHRGGFPPHRANKSYQTEQNPAGVHHQEFLAPYLPGFVYPPQNYREAAPFWCPGDFARKEKLSWHSYGINILHGLTNEDRLVNITNPGQNLYLIDATRGTLSTCRLNNKAWPYTLGSTGRTPPSGPSADPRVDFRHREKANALFLDGHVRAFPLDPLVGRSPSNMPW